MTLHESGKEHTDILLMIHGSCMAWDMYKEAAGILSQHFHVLVPALPGYDSEKPGDFTSVGQVVKELENWLLASGYGELKCLYGFSMGGGIAIRFLADNRIHVCKAIIDAGITPYQLPYVLTRCIAVRDYCMIQLGRSSKKLLAKAFPPEKYTQKGLDRLYDVMRNMNCKTVWRTFESTNNYSMPQAVPSLSTAVSYWYGSREKKERAWDIAYVKKIFPCTQFRELPGMEHGEYCLMHQKKFSGDVVRFVYGGSDNTHPPESAGFL